MNDETLLNIVTTGETLVSSHRGRLNSICLNSAITSPITIYDSTSNSGTKIGTIADNSPAGTYLMYGGRTQNGIYICSDDAVHASGILTSDTTNPHVDDTVTIGTTVYRFKSTLLAINDIKIGANTDATLTSLAKTINGTGAAGTDHFAGTPAHPDVTSSTVSVNALTITAKVAGTAGNAIAKAESSDHLDWDGAGGFLTSGTEGPAFDLTVSFCG